MDLDEMLKQEITIEGDVTETTPVEEPIVISENADHNKNIFIDNLGVCLNKDYEESLVADLKMLGLLQNRIDAKKEEIKAFIETNKLGGFSTNLLKVKYTSATTTTTIDSARLKKEQPELAAEYSKVGCRKSSVSFELQDVAKDVIDLG